MDSLLKSNTTFSDEQGKKINKRNSAIKSKAKYKTNQQIKQIIK